jgi:lysophospholipase L1-like esterase
VSFQRYVALGDSTTEGLEDLNPDGTYRGWADRLAELIAVESPDLRYANLAIRGRKLPQIRAEQLEPALAMEPDLASVLGGLNDILRREVDLAARADDLEAMVSALRGSGATVLVMTFPDPTAVITVAAARIRARVDAFNAAIREIAGRQDAVLVDMERKSDPHPSFWCADRLHANSRGHEWIAAMAASELGVPVPDGDWNADLPPHRPAPRPVRLASDAAWMGRHLAPWVLRRVRGRSSGDGIEPKRPELAPVRTSG